MLPVTITGVTFWDSLEHIPSPKDLLMRVKKQTVFVSIPIINNILFVRTSKHYKPNEHFWYFTKEGFINYMDGQGFSCEDHNTMETDAGREDIDTFVFRR